MITKTILITKLAILCKLLGKKLGNKEGDWNLDLAHCYGGYIIIEYLDKGGEHHPLINRRLKAKEMDIALDMAIATEQLIKEGK